MKQPIAFGKYLLLERINVGGMAEIFLARSRGVHGFKRILAIKKILPTMAEDQEFIAMFVDEARIAAELSHAAIVQIFELGRYEQDYYIAMEFVHGKDLRYIQERMARDKQRVPIPLVGFIGHKICEALDYAHTKKDPMGRPLGIIHRDVSPQNIIISYEGEVKICDFGIAKAANRSQKTQAGVLKGKFGYMSPEQVRGLPLDGRSDLFTVGTLLYEMVTLERLFVGESDFSTLEKVRNADVVPPSTYNQEVPEELEEIILKALSKEVEDRFQSSSEFADALQVFVLQQGMASSRDVSKFMKETFAGDLEAELRRYDEYQTLPESALESDQEATDQNPEACQVDLEAKTLIFATSEKSADGVEEFAPTPVRHAAGKPSSSALSDAKTALFISPDLPEESPVHEAPTQGVIERPDPGLLEDTRERPRHETTRHRRRSLQNRYFLPVAVAAALLFGWSLFTTFRLVLSGPGSSEFRLITWPASGVKVSLDGAEVTRVTPYVVRDLAPGPHRLQVVHSAYEEVDRKFDLEPGVRMVMELVLSKKVAPAVTEPAVQSGATDANGLNLAETNVPPKAGETGKPPVTVKQPEPGKQPKPVPARATELRVDSDPSGAQVFLDGKPIGKTPIEGLRVRPRPVAFVKLNLKGFQPASRKIEIKSGEKNALQVTLVKTARPPVVGDTANLPKPPVVSPVGEVKYGYLVANTRPWSKVHVDGKYTGRETPIAPDKRLKLTAGKHEVVFETPGGKRYPFEVIIEPEQVYKLIKRLE